MNKIDFKNIKNQFDSSINLLDDSIYNGGIFSFSICLGLLSHFYFFICVLSYETAAPR